MMGPLDECCKALAVECCGFPFCFLQVLRVLYGTSVSNRLDGFGDQKPTASVERRRNGGAVSYQHHAKVATNHMTVRLLF